MLKNSINEDCILWFLNPHLKKVSMLPELWFHSNRVMEKLKLIGCGITSLSLKNSEASENDLISVVSCFSNVVHLNLSHTACSDKTLTCIQDCCPNLESLNIADCYKVTDCGMDILCQGKLSLKKLNIFYTLVTKSGIFTVLERMPSLEYIEHHELLPSIHQFSLSKKKPYNLTELVYDAPNIQDKKKWCDDLHLNVIQAFVKVCPRLKKLHFLSPVSKDVLNACVHFQNLEELKIKLFHRDVNKKYDVLDPILPISKNLKTLILSCVKISVVKLINYFNNLENLHLKSVSFTKFNKDDIKITEMKLLSLVMKDFHMKPVIVTSIALLVSLSKNVTKWCFQNCKNLSKNSIIFEHALNYWKNLTLVNFRSTNMDSQLANSFFQIPSMRTVIMDKSTDTLEVFRESTSCTLSWRYMSDAEYTPEYNIYEFYKNRHKKYYYDKNYYVNNEADVLSEKCWTYVNSDESEYASSAEEDAFLYSVHQHSPVHLPERMEEDDDERIVLNVPRIWSYHYDSDGHEKDNSAGEVASLSQSSSSDFNDMSDQDYSSYSSRDNKSSCSDCPDGTFNANSKADSFY